MKNPITLTVLTVIIGIFGITEISAQKKPSKAKDLFTQYTENNPSTIGAEGVKISILLKRGNAETRIVSPNETFYSGDKIKLILGINFNGYAVILNKGTSGKINPIFPYIENSRLVDYRLSSNAAVEIPKGNVWINFDNNPGEEELTVIFSKFPIEELSRYQEILSGKEIDEMLSSQILNELNGKSISHRKSKDLFTQNENDGAYYVSQSGLDNQPIGFSFFLKHR